MHLRRLRLGYLILERLAAARRQAEFLTVLPRADALDLIADRCFVVMILEEVNAGFAKPNHEYFSTGTNCDMQLKDCSPTYLVSSHSLGPE